MQRRFDDELPAELVLVVSQIEPRDRTDLLMPVYKPRNVWDKQLKYGSCSSLCGLWSLVCVGVPALMGLLGEVLMVSPPQ